MTKTFASDNAAGVHPAIMDAMIAANKGHALAYGRDEYTERARAKFRDHFGSDAGVYFVYGGTGANVAGLSAALGDSYLVVCADGAHIHKSEEGAPQAFTGCRMLPVEAPDGKLTVDNIDKYLGRRDKFGVISIAQPTEYGTVYSPAEINTLSRYASNRGFAVHMDGARICNAAAYLNADFADITRGVDVLSFGGTKIGMPYGEAVVILNKDLDAGFAEKRVRATQRPSKMRYISAMFDALLTDDLWLHIATHENCMASQLHQRIFSLKGVEITQPVESNAVFARIPSRSIPVLQEKYYFHPWDRDDDAARSQERREVRWMTAWDHTPLEIREFAYGIEDAVKQPRVT